MNEEPMSDEQIARCIASIAAFLLRERKKYK